MLINRYIYCINVIKALWKLTFVSAGSTAPSCGWVISGKSKIVLRVLSYKFGEILGLCPIFANFVLVNRALLDRPYCTYAIFAVSKCIHVLIVKHIYIIIISSDFQKSGFVLPFCPCNINMNIRNSWTVYLHNI